MKIEKIDEFNGLTIFRKKLKKHGLILSSTAMSIALSACGREVRSTDEVPLVDETRGNGTDTAVIQMV